MPQFDTYSFWFYEKHDMQFYVINDWDLQVPGDRIDGYTRGDSM